MMLAANIAFMVGSVFLFLGTLLSTLHILGVLK
jgi:hypothetical protein